MLETTFSFNDDFEPKGGNCLHFTVGTSDIQMINSFWCGGGLIEDRSETFSWVGVVIDSHQTNLSSTHSIGI